MHTAELDLDRYLVPFTLRSVPLYRFDVVVLGGGVAGASAALAAAKSGASVAVLTKAGLKESNTYYAQGGMAAALATDDSVEAHAADTMRVGYGLADRRVVDAVVRGGPGAVERLLQWGVEFDRDAEGELDLSREGGHSLPRILHARGAATGLEIQRRLTRALKHDPRITTFPNTMALDLLTSPEGRALGLLVATARGDLAAFGAAQVVLATGGAGQIYRETTNPAIATGDGMALAFRAGAKLRDMELVQFHPTCLYIAGAARVLISEVVRGAGGVLLDRHGVRFMPEFHPDAELAPRDVVSRAASRRMVQTRDTSVYLDLSGLDKDPHALFPGISKICAFFGIDIARDPIPVRPGAHYWVGGLRVDLAGRTNVPGLWAVGECASTGLHGANRMGSNSLLEGAVFGTTAGALAAEASSSGDPFALDDRTVASRPAPPKGVQLSLTDLTYSLKSLMWRQVGVERTGEGLRDALEKIAFWTRAMQGLGSDDPAAWELLNMLTVARLTTHAALAREESRGVHYRRDFPEAREEWRCHTLVSQVPGPERLGPLEVTTEPVPEEQAVA